MEKFKLKQTRVRKGFTQQQMADALPTVISNYCKKESGTTKISIPSPNFCLPPNKNILRGWKRKMLSLKRFWRKNSLFFCSYNADSVVGLIAVNLLPMFQIPPRVALIQ
jgi:hypothetical protein